MNFVGIPSAFFTYLFALIKYLPPCSLIHIHISLIFILLQQGRTKAPPLRLYLSCVSRRPSHHRNTVILLYSPRLSLNGRRSYSLVNLAVVCTDVVLEVSLLHKPLVAVRAPVGPLPCVYPGVAGQVGWVQEGLATGLTSIGWLL